MEPGEGGRGVGAQEQGGADALRGGKAAGKEPDGVGPCQGPALREQAHRSGRCNTGLVENTSDNDQALVIAV